MYAYRPVAMAVPRRLSAPLPSPTEPPPAPDALYAGYVGAAGLAESLAVLAATGAAAWVGIRTALDKKSSTTLKTAGWIGGVGSALAGLLYVGAKSGLSDKIGLPAVRITPA